MTEAVSPRRDLDPKAAGVLTNLCPNPIVASGGAAIFASDYQQVVAAPTETQPNAPTNLRASPARCWRMQAQHNATTTAGYVLLNIGLNNGANIMPAEAGKQYTAQAFVQVHDAPASGQMFFSIDFYTAAGAYTGGAGAGNADFTGLADANGRWVSVTSAVAPAGTGIVFFRVWNVNWVTANDTIDYRFTMLQCVEGTSPKEVIVGSDSGCEWAGTAHASASRRVAQVNKLNGSFETDSSGWVVYGNGSIATSTNWAKHGTKSLRASGSSPGGGGYQGVGFEHSQIHPTGGVPYTYYASAKVVDAWRTRPCSFLVQSFDSAGNFVSTDKLVDIVPASTIAEGSVLGTVTHDPRVALSRVMVYADESPSNVADTYDWYIDKLSLVPDESSPSEWFETSRGFNSVKIPGGQGGSELTFNIGSLDTINNLAAADAARLREAIGYPPNPDNLLPALDTPFLPQLGDAAQGVSVQAYPSMDWTTDGRAGAVLVANVTVAGTGSGAFVGYPWVEDGGNQPPIEFTPKTAWLWNHVDVNIGITSDANGIHAAIGFDLYDASYNWVGGDYLDAPSQTKGAVGLHFLENWVACPSNARYIDPYFYFYNFTLNSNKIAAGVFSNWVLVNVAANGARK